MCMVSFTDFDSHWFILLLILILYISCFLVLAKYRLIIHPGKSLTSIYFKQYLYILMPNVVLNLIQVLEHSRSRKNFNAY